MISPFSSADVILLAKSRDSHFEFTVLLCIAINLILCSTSTGTVPSKSASKDLLVGDRVIIEGVQVLR